MKKIENHWTRFADEQEGDGTGMKILRKILWIVATLRNAFVLAVTSTILYTTQMHCPFNVSLY